MAKKRFSGNGWSFEPAARQPEPPRASLPDDQQKAKIVLEKRPRGKEATVVNGFRLSDPDRKVLAACLKKLCGAGGKDTDEAIEIQGDHRTAIREYLSARGWRVR